MIFRFWVKWSFNIEEQCRLNVSRPNVREMLFMVMSSDLLWCHVIAVLPSVQHSGLIAHHLIVIWLVRGRRPTCPAELSHSTGVGGGGLQGEWWTCVWQGKGGGVQGSLESNPIERGSDAESWESCRDGQARCKTDSKEITDFRLLTHSVMTKPRTR